MSAVDTMSIQQIRARYLQSLSPMERMDYELACAREKRLVAEREQERRETERLLVCIEYRATNMREGLTLSHDQIKLLAAELRRLKGNAA